MLLQFRKVTRGAVATIIVALIGIATVLFLIPQNGIQLAGSSHVAEVGGQGITPAQLSRDLDSALKQMRNQGRDVTRQDAIDQGAHNQILDQMIQQRALGAYAERIGVSAADSQVAEMVRRIPGATNPISGQFDPEQFERFARQQGYQRQELLDELRGDLTRSMTLEALAAGVRVPQSYGALALTFAAETRVVSIAQAEASAVGRIDPPTPEQLQTFYEENQQRLQVPEFRALTLIYARPADFAARVNVPEDRIRQEFEERRESLTQPERRTYIRIAAQNQQQANDAAARLNRGEAPSAVATALSLQMTRGENEPRANVPDSRVAEAVFSAPLRQARAVQAQLTPWAVVRVESITPAVAPDYAAQRDELRQAIAADQAAEMRDTAVTTFEDARASGTSIADAARANGLTVVNIPAVTAEGLGADGQPVAAVTGQEELLRTAFQTPESEASDFMPVGDADVIVAVDSITPATVRPLAEVRDGLIQLWTAREAGRRLREMGDQVIAAVRGGQSFAAAARAHRFNVVLSSQTISRRDTQQIPSRGIGQQIFTAPQGGVVADMRVDGRAVLVASVEQINRVNPVERPQEVEAFRGREQEGVLRGYAEALQGEVVARANVRRNEQLLNQVFRPTANANAEGEETPQP